MSDAQIIAVLRAYADYLHVTNFVSDGLRWIGYMIIYGLTTIVNGLSSIVANMYKLLNFWGYAPFQKFLLTYQPVIWALATLGLVWAGLLMMHNKRVDYQEKGNNFLVALLLFFGLTFLMTQGTQLITAGAQQAMLNTPSAVSIYQSNIIDVYMLDKAGWKISDGKAVLPNPANQIKNLEDIKLLNIDEKVDTGGWFGGSQASSDGTAILGKQLSMNASGEWELHNMQGAFKIDDNYYRYSWHPWILAANLLLYLITVAIVIFKLVKIILEINFIGLLAQGAALTDFDSGKRNRQLIGKLRDSFVVAFLLCVILEFYAQFLSFLTATGVGGLTQVFAMVGGLLFVIDGPNIIQAIFGIDAGLSSMAQTMTNVMLLARGAGGATKSALGVAKKVASTTKGITGGGLVAGAAAVGFGAGLAKKPSLPSDKSSNNTESDTTSKKPDVASDQAESTKETPMAADSTTASRPATNSTDADPTQAADFVVAPDLGTDTTSQTHSNINQESDSTSSESTHSETETDTQSAPDLAQTEPVVQAQPFDAGHDYSEPDAQAPELPAAAKALIGSKLKPDHVGQFTPPGQSALDPSTKPTLGTSLAQQALGTGPAIDRSVPDFNDEPVSTTRETTGTNAGSQPSFEKSQAQTPPQSTSTTSGSQSVSDYGVPHVSTQSMPRNAASMIQASQTAMINDQNAALDDANQFDTQADQALGTVITNRLTDANINARQSLVKSPTVLAVRRAYRVGQATGAQVRGAKEPKK